MGAQAREVFLRNHDLLLKPAQQHYDEVLARYDPNGHLAEDREG